MREQKIFIATFALGVAIASAGGLGVGLMTTRPEPEPAPAPPAATISHAVIRPSPQQTPPRAAEAAPPPLTSTTGALDAAAGSATGEIRPSALARDAKQAHGVVPLPPPSPPVAEPKAAVALVSPVSPAATPAPRTVTPRAVAPAPRQTRPRAFRAATRVAARSPRPAVRADSKPQPRRTSSIVIVRGSLPTGYQGRVAASGPRVIHVGDPR